MLRLKMLWGRLCTSLKRHISIDFLQDASADSFAAWLKEHPSVELISRDRGTTFADLQNGDKRNQMGSGFFRHPGVEFHPSVKSSILQDKIGQPFG
jgi:hypothetical protein